jgi:hypothetical protein
MRAPRPEIQSGPPSASRSGTLIAATYTTSWVLWGGSILAGGLNAAVGTLLLALGGFGPSAVAVILVSRQGSSARADLTSRIVDRRRLTLPVAVAAFAAAIVADTFLMTAIYNRTDRSVLSAIAFHWGKDYASDPFAVVPLARALRAGIAVVLAAALVVAGGLRPLSRAAAADAGATPVPVR